MNSPPGPYPGPSAASPSFREIRLKGLPYVDKTEAVFRILSEPGKIIMLTRPRGMGKSLLASALSEALSGQRKLFEGLWLGESGYDFKPHPVVRLTFKPSGSPYESLAAAALEACRECGLKLRDGPPGEALARLVKDLRKKAGKPCAVVIDDYDLIIGAAGKGRLEEAAQATRDLLVRLSALGGELRLLFLAGTRRYSDSVLFKDRALATDLTFDPSMAACCGFTASELDANFLGRIEEARDHLAASGQWDPKWTAADLRRWAIERYDGHSWDGSATVMSPVSVLGFLREKRLRDFWTEAFEVPSSLIRKLLAEDAAGKLLEETMTLPAVSWEVGLRDWPLESWLLQEGVLSVQKIIEAAPRRIITPLVLPPGRFGQLGEPPYAKDKKRLEQLKADEEAAAEAARRAERKRIFESRKMIVRLSTLEIQSRLYREAIALKWSHEKTGFAGKALDYLSGALISLDPKLIEIAFKKLMAGLRQPMYVSDRDWFHTAIYYSLRSLGRHLDPKDPVHEGVVDVAIDNPGQDVILLQVRSADHAWTPKALKMPEKGEESWPWRPPPPKVLKDWEAPLDETEDGDLIELERVLGLEAMLAVKVLEDWGYPMRWLPLGRRVFMVGVGVYKRQRARAVVQEAFPYEDDDAAEE
ncbi:MAG: AAA family ATPase [Deltaproteobacteria bacterium]|jgi:SpoVK/Ycf46/Vps4 family AAA+-type ATPase|nr:AAA family ATPase [Deltaproteobacteria bacterium]